MLKIKNVANSVQRSATMLSIPLHVGGERLQDPPSKHIVFWEPSIVAIPFSQENVQLLPTLFPSLHETSTSSPASMVGQFDPLKSG